MPRFRTIATSVVVMVAAVLFGAPADAATSHREHKIQHAQHWVKKQRGDPYVYGAAGPAAFDCSGLMQYAYGKAGLYLPRTADAQYRFVRHVPMKNLRSGDFVYWHAGSHVFHVAMFAGRSHGQAYVWEAAHTGTVVQRNPIWDAPRWGGTLRR